MALNAKEIEFAHNYIVEPNAYQAALKAGYADSTAKDSSKWINPEESLKKPNKFKQELYDYIEGLRKNDKREEAAILSRVEKKKILAEIARNVNNDISDRIRAIDTDNKMDGEYTNNVRVEGNINNPFEGLTTEQLLKMAGDS
jgi:phage terminase small subunit